MDHGPSPQTDGQYVRHSEVRPHPSDVHCQRRLARKSFLYHTDICRRPSDVHDDRILQTRQMHGASDGIRWTARNGKDRVLKRILTGHQRSVILS